MIPKFALVAFLVGSLTTPVVSQTTAMSIPAIARRAKGSVLLIEGWSSDGKTIYEGTGFVVRSDGVVVTNYHVIAQDATAVAKLPDGAYFPVKGVLAADSKRDIAVLKLAASGLRTLSLGDSNDVQVGQAVVAIGNPESLESSVSSGIVSGVRNDSSLGGQFLQVTTPISHGSSGGPLFDMRGDVVGITTMYVKGGENLNFAIPIDALKPLLQHESARVRPLPNGGLPQAEPAAQSTSTSNNQHTTEYYKGYVKGYSDGWSDGFTQASTPTKPTGEPALYVDSVVSNDDTVGATFVYDLKSDIASSPLYTLANSVSSAAFRVDVITVSSNDGIDTDGAVIIVCGGSSTVSCALGQFVDAFAFTAGSSAVDNEAQNVMASIDQAISSLPTKK